MGLQGQAAKQRREGKALALCAFPASWFTGLLAVALPGVGEMLLLCLPTAFFFASVAALVGSLSPPRAPGHPGVLPVVAGGAYGDRCKNRHPSLICTQF